jgi:hypothetical protein
MSSKRTAAGLPNLEGQRRRFTSQMRFVAVLGSVDFRRGRQ